MPPFHLEKKLPADNEVIVELVEVGQDGELRSGDVAKGVEMETINTPDNEVDYQATEEYPKGR